MQALGIALLPLLGLAAYFLSRYLPAPIKFKVNYDESVVVFSLSPVVDLGKAFSNRSEPVLLRNTVVSTWPALSKWNPDHFSNLDNQVVLKNVYRQTTPIFRHFTGGKPLEDLFQLKRPFSTVDLTIGEFIERCKRDPTGYYYWSDNLEALGEDLNRDVHSLSMLALDKKQFKKKAWISSANVVADAHYDAYHNFFVQVYGNKTFRLLPPSQHGNLYLHPISHPYLRQAQSNILEPDLEHFPNLSGATPIEVTIGAGDVLYLPPFWFHHVVTHSISVSVNVWSEDDALKEVNGLPYFPLPFQEEWSKETSYAAVKVFSDMIIKAAGAPNATSAFMERLRRTRYDALPPDQAERLKAQAELDRNGRGLGSANFCSGLSDLLQMQLRHEFQPAVDRFVDILARTRDQGARNICLENFIEDCIVHFTSPSLVSTFISQCWKLPLA